MTSDKRKVATDALETLGTIIDHTASRDAIHLAVEPCIAGETLSPGEDIGIVDGLAMVHTTKPLGIVDPFLKAPVKKGERFWLIIYPRTITSLRHVWEHPSFESNRDKEDELRESEKWLINFCESNNLPEYPDVISAVLGQDLGTSSSVHFSGRDASGEIPDEFWDHMERITGIKYNERPTYFSCSC